MAARGASTGKNVAAKAADAGLAAVGSGMSSLAGSIRDKGPHSGVLGSAASTVAGGLAAGGHYLQKHGLGDMPGDLTTLIRRHPLPALFVSFGLGFVLARVTSRR